MEDPPQYPPGRSRRGVLAVVVLVEGGLLGLAWGLGKLTGAPLAHAVRVDAAAIGWGLLASVPSVLFIAWSLRTRWSALARLRERVRRDVGALFAGCSLGDLVVVSTVAGVAEEALFRAVGIGALTRLAGPWVALIATSTLFGLVHFISPAYVVFAGVAGAYWGVLFLASGNAIVPMIGHAVHDLVALAVLLHGAPGRGVRGGVAGPSGPTGPSRGGGRLPPARRASRGPRHAF